MLDTIAGLRSLPPMELALHERLPALRDELYKVLLILRRESVAPWQRGVESCLGELDAALDGRLDVSEAFTNVRDIWRSMHGGMGSFNDLVLWRENQEEMARVNDELESRKTRVGVLLAG